jgi:hypothetical protein
MRNVLRIKKGIGTKTSWAIFLYALFVLFCFYPYEFYSVYFTWLPNLAFVTQIICLLLTIFIALICCGGKIKVDEPLGSLFLIQLVGFAIVQLAHGHFGPTIVRASTMILSIVLISLINSTIGLVVFFKRYNTWLLIMALMGVAAWFLVVFVDFQPAFTVIDRADKREIDNYLITFTKSKIWEVGTFRYAGFFDEPGSMAMWGLYGMIINKLFIKNKWLDYILIPALIFTFSMGFYFQIALYLYFFYTNRKKWARNIIVFVLILFAIRGLGTLQNSDFYKVYDMTIGRVENFFDTGQSGTIDLDNREQLMIIARNHFYESPIFGVENKGEYYSDNVYSLLAEYGVFGCLFVLSPFIFLIHISLKKKDYDLLKCMIVIIVGFAHRPFQIHMIYFFIIYCIAVMYLQSRSSRAELLGYAK